MSFNIALSGLAAAQKDIDTTANNIANVNTTGFKESRAEFADVYATSMEIKTSIWPSLQTQYAKERRASAKKIGELELTSPLIVSAFGDNGVFFKHQRHEDK